MLAIDTGWLAFGASIFGGAVLIGKALGVLDRLAKAVDNLAISHSASREDITRNTTILETHEKRLDGHDDLLKELTR